MSAVHAGELHAEAGHASRAENQHDFSRLQVPALDQGMPRRQRGARQGGRLLQAEVLGHGNHTLLGQQCKLGQHALEHAAQRVLRGIGRDAAAEPGLEERAGNTFTDAHTLNAASDCRDLTRAIRQRDQRELRVAVDAPNDTQVAGVEGASPDPHQHLAGARFRVHAIGGGDQAVEPHRLLQLVGSHAGSPLERPCSIRTSTHSTPEVTGRVRSRPIRSGLRISHIACAEEIAPGGRSKAKRRRLRGSGTIAIRLIVYCEAGSLCRGALRCQR